MRHAAIITIALWAAPAGAQELTPAQQEARQHYEAAEALAAREEWAGALGEFARAYELAEGLPTRHLIRMDVALANAELGRHRETVRLLELFMQEAPADEPQRVEAQRRLDEARRQVALERGFEPSPVGLTILAVGAASVIAGAILGGLALQQDGDARAMCVGTSCTQSSLDAIGGAHDLAIGADVLLFGGLGIATLGAILSVALGSSGGTSASAMCTDQGCELEIAGRF
jgi:hypothetical protein